MSAILLAFYAGVAVLALHPKVSEAYRDYYIDHNTEISMAERKNLPPVQLHTPYSHQTKSLGFVGWSAPEREHRWTDGRSAKIVFQIDATAAEGMPGEICMTVIPLKRQRLHWQLNSGPWKEYIMENPEEWHIALAREQLQPGENVLRLALPDARQPGNGDSRLLAIAIKKIVFLPPKP